MMHLTEDQIYHLVEAIGNHETLTAEEEQQMEHIRSCKECMESYCIMAVLAEATRVDCDLVLNPVYSEEETAESARKLLAAIRVTCERIQDQISLIGEQIQNQFNKILYNLTGNDQSHYGRHKGITSRYLTSLSTFSFCSRRTDAMRLAADRHIINWSYWLLL